MGANQGPLISWKSKKEPIVTRSSSKAKQCTMTHEHVDCCALVLKILQHMLGFKKESPMILHCIQKPFILFQTEYSMSVQNIMKLIDPVRTMTL